MNKSLLVASFAVLSASVLGMIPNNPGGNFEGNDRKRSISQINGNTWADPGNMRLRNLPQPSRSSSSGSSSNRVTTDTRNNLMQRGETDRRSLGAEQFRLTLEETLELPLEYILQVPTGDLRKMTLDEVARRLYTDEAFQRLNSLGINFGNNNNKRNSSRIRKVGEKKRPSQRKRTFAPRGVPVRSVNGLDLLASVAIFTDQQSQLRQTKKQTTSQDIANTSANSSGAYH